MRAAPSAIRRAWTEPEGRTIEGNDLYDRVRFDDAFQVAVVGDNVYFGSSVDHKVYCLDAASGLERWSFFTGAAVRLAPTVVDGRVYAGSDDGYVYCLDAAGGELIWKFRPGPAEEWFLGRGEMISRWPVRTGVLVDGRRGLFRCGHLSARERLYVRRRCGGWPRHLAKRQHQPPGGRSRRPFAARLSARLGRSRLCPLRTHATEGV